MADEQIWIQSLADVKRGYGASTKWFYIGSVIGSTSAYTFFNFSGTNTGFGPSNNQISNRVMIVASGGNTAPVQYQVISGTLGGDLSPGETQAVDGKSISGLWVRSNTAAQQFRLWAW